MRRDDADRAGHGGRLRHDGVCARADVVPAARRDVGEVRNHRLLLGDPGELVVDAVGSEHAPAGRVDHHHHACNP